jgi:multiple sugar transport system permease protein
MPDVQPPTVSSIVIDRPDGSRAPSDGRGRVDVAAPLRGRSRRTPAAARRHREALTAYLLILPALIPFLCFVAGPLIGAIVLSFYRYNLLTPAKFIGLNNYRFLVHDHIALVALGVTAVFTVASVVLHVVVGLALAIAADRRMPKALSYGVRVAVFFPVLISWAVVSLIAQYTLDPNFGFIPYYLAKIGVHINWFTDPHTALAAIILVDLWHTVGFSFIVLLAGLQVIPQHLYEAARVDGASSWRVLRSITLPLLSPSLFFVVVISFIGAFQIFEPVHIITNGGPGNSTESIVQYIYDKGFTQLHMGYAATLGLVVFAVLLTMTILQFGIGKFWVHDDLGGAG